MSVTGTWKSTETPDTAATKRKYMRDYMAKRRADHIRVTSHDHIVKASACDVGRHERRDGAPMWPERAIGRDPAINLAEVKTAERHRKRGIGHG